jgi:hypothetical protein
LLIENRILTGVLWAFTIFLLQQVHIFFAFTEMGKGMH